MCRHDACRPITGYNNKILVATKNMSPGQNNDLNTEKLPPASVAISAADTPSIPGSSVRMQPDTAITAVTEAPPAVVHTEQQSRSSNVHDNSKTLLTLVAVGAGVIYYLIR